MQNPWPRLALVVVLAFVASAVGCNALNGSDDLAIEPFPTASNEPREGGLVEAGAGDARDAAAEGPPAYAVAGWAYRRPIALSSDLTEPVSGRPVLVTLSASFDYARTSANGGDLRFTNDLARAADLPYFVEDWTPGGASHVWVSVPSVPTGSSLIHVFYGNASALPASSFDATFPKARRTAGSGSGSFVASGDIDVDWFELRAGDTLTLAAGVPLRISASRIVIAGAILGTGRGSPGGAIPSGPGSGPGGGMIAAGSGAGGGGYGGAGGQGGSDSNAGGAGGAVNGTAAGADIAMGSGGGTMDGKPAGAGGGALTLAGWRVSVSSAVTMDGTAGMGLSGQNSGGGSGGGILVAGWSLDLGGATLSARGGTGGPCAQAANDAGGGGGGGRIKIRRRASGALVPAGSMSVAAGIGGAGAGTTAPGAPGVMGTTDVNEASSSAQGVESSVGAEVSASAR